MSSNNKVSVVIPMYNASSTIINTLSSVKEQTLPVYEVIVVDDGSTDDSPYKVRNFISENIDLKIKLLQKSNGGVSSARNMGMKMAEGDFIALLDSDDFWLPNKVERQIEVFSKNPNIDLLGTNRNGERFTRFFLKKFHNVTVISSRLLLLKWFFPTPTVMFKREVFESVGGFDEKQRYAEEGNFWLRVCSENCCALLNESLVITGFGKPDFGHSGLSGNLKEMQKGEYKNIKDAFNIRIINKCEYYFLFLYSTLKYLRRIVIVKCRN